MLFHIDIWAIIIQKRKMSTFELQNVFLVRDILYLFDMPIHKYLTPKLTLIK